MTEPLLWWIHIFMWHACPWCMSVSKHVTLHFFNRIRQPDWHCKLHVFVVANLSQCMDLPRNACLDIICNSVTLNRGQPLTVWWKWWFTGKSMITWSFVIGVAFRLCLLMPTLNMMAIWLNVQFFCILLRGCRFPSCHHPMEVTHEDVPMQIAVVLGNLASLGLDYGAQNVRAMKRKDLPSRNSLPGNGGKEVEVGKTMVLRHKRGLMALQSQNSYVLFLLTAPEGMLAPLLKESAHWKQLQQQHQVTMP